MTTLKNTAKPVTDVQFPAVTICGSGFHMGNVEEKINRNFRKWRNETGRNSNDTDQIKADMVEYMEITFQIKPKQEGDQGPANIMDILDTMVASNVEASMAANAVRENVIACNQSEGETKRIETATSTNPKKARRRKKRTTSSVNGEVHGFELKLLVHANATKHFKADSRLYDHAKPNFVL